MSFTVIMEGKGPLRLTDRDYRASGGEAAVYCQQGLALKIYHDPMHCLSPLKRDELRHIGAANVTLPDRLLFNEAGRAVGFSMPFVANAQPLVKLFSAHFKRKHHLDPAKVSLLLQAMRLTLERIHKAQCLVVDLNELNVLIDSKGDPVFIDVDSYMSPSFPATAIMASVVDYQASAYSRLTDWFSFAILAFQCFMGIHPYKGSHPNYKASQWQQRMIDGVSVFDPQVVLPPAMGDFSQIPPVWLNWFRSLFEHNQRLPPPSDDSLQVVFTPPMSRTHAPGQDLYTRLVFECPSTIRAAYTVASDLFAVTDGGLYRNGQLYPNGLGANMDAIVAAEDGTPVFLVHRDGVLSFAKASGQIFDRVSARAFFLKDGVVYTVDHTNLTEHRFTRLGKKLLRKNQSAGRLDGYARVYDGVIFTRLLGKTWMMNPGPQGTFFGAMPQLDDKRIVSARARADWCEISAEKKGQWFHITLTRTRGNWSVSCEPGQTYEPDFAVLPGGLRVSYQGDTLSVSAAGSGMRDYKYPPLDGGGGLFVHQGRLHFITKSSIKALSTKPFSCSQPTM